MNEPVRWKVFCFACGWNGATNKSPWLCDWCGDHKILMHRTIPLDEVEDLSLVEGDNYSVFSTLRGCKMAIRNDDSLLASYHLPPFVLTADSERCIVCPVTG